MVDQIQNEKSESESPVRTVLAVLVLYRMGAEQSPAYQSLQRLRETDKGIDGWLELLLWDNSPQPEPLPPSFQGSSFQDPRNPGLVAAYTQGLRQATENGIPWMLLLDQDTEVSSDFLHELYRTVKDVDAGVSAIVPRLLHGREVVSPLLPAGIGPPRVYDGVAGLFAASVRSQTLQAFNSGSTFRTATLQKLGGFDPLFPLDYLDHATFARLQSQGGRIWVLNATLSHSLSTHTGRRSTAAQRKRQSSILAAERRFYQLHGAPLDRVLHPVRLLRRAASELLKKRDLPGAWQIVRHLF